MLLILISDNSRFNSLIDLFSKYEDIIVYIQCYKCSEKQKEPKKRLSTPIVMSQKTTENHTHKALECAIMFSLESIENFLSEACFEKKGWGLIGERKEKENLEAVLMRSSFVYAELERGLVECI